MELKDFLGWRRRTKVERTEIQSKRLGAKDSSTRQCQFASGSIRFTETTEVTRARRTREFAVFLQRIRDSNSSNCRPAYLRRILIFGRQAKRELWKLAESAASQNCRMPRPTGHSGAGSCVALRQRLRKSRAAAAVFRNLARMSAKESPRPGMKSIAVRLSSGSRALKQTQWPLRLATSFGRTEARSSVFTRVEASGARIYPGAAAMLSNGLRLMASNSTLVAVDGDQRRIVDRAVADARRNREGGATATSCLAPEWLRGPVRS